MSASSYAGALARLLAHEGGYSNHPTDPGGPTKHGITLADYRRFVKADATATDVKAMSIEAARAIYRAHYWDVLRCDELPAGIDYAIFDYGVNSGVGRAGKVLRRVLGLSDAASAVTDAVLGRAKAADAATTVAAICDERMAFLRGLNTWPVFGRGWERRVTEVRAEALALAQAASVGPTEASPTPADRARPQRPALALLRLVAAALRRILSRTPEA